MQNNETQNKPIENEKQLNIINHVTPNLELATKIAETLHREMSNIHKENKDKFTKENLIIHVASKDSGEFTVSWTIQPKKWSPYSGGESDYEIFTKHLDIINKLDGLILEVLEGCKKMKLSYAVKICKHHKLPHDCVCPPLITSYISFNFPPSDYYLTKYNDGIEDTLEELNKRKEVFGKSK